MSCQDCGHTWSGPGYQADLAPHPCPNCGGYRTQPVGVNDEFQLRDMPNGQDDMGGNPLQEGVWGSIDGGWQNRMKRDESFASVKKEAIDLGGEYYDLPSGGQGRYYHCPNCGGQMNTATGECYQCMYSYGQDGAPYDGEFMAPNIDPSGLGPVRQGTTKEAIDTHWDGPHINPGAPDESGARKWSTPCPQCQSSGYLNNDGSRPCPNCEATGYLYTPVKGRGGEGPAYRGVQYMVPNIDPENNGLGPVRQGSADDFLPKQQTSEGLYDENGMAIPPPQQPGAYVPGQKVRLHIPDDPRLHGLEGTYLRPDNHYPGAHFVEVPGLNYKPWVTTNMMMNAEGGEDPTWHNFWHGKKMESSRSKLYMPFDRDASKIAMDFEIDRVVEPGPHTVETQNGVVMQHDDPDVLNEAREKVEARRKQAFLPLLLGLGEGLAGSALGGAAVRGAMGGLISGALRSGGGGGGGAAQAPQQQQALPDQFIASIHEELTAGKSDMSDDNFTERADGDPDDVDPHEFNDGEDSLAKDDTGIGTDAFRPEVQQALEEAMPKLLEFYHSDASGADDPSIQKLVDILQQYDPELLDHDTPEGRAVLEQHLPKISAGVPGIGAQPAMTQPLMPSGNTPVNPVTQANCPHCGAMVTPGSGVCGQCGGALMAPNAPQNLGQAAPGTAPTPGQATGVLAAYEVGGPVSDLPSPMQQRGLTQAPPNTPCRFCGQPAVVIRNGSYLCPQCEQQTRLSANQGPHNLEQMQAVVGFLKQQGQYTPEVAEDLIMNPDNYADVLAQITQRQDPPNPDPDPGPPPPQPDPSQMGGMPMGMPPGGGGGMPMAAAFQQDLPSHCATCGEAIAPTAIECPYCGSWQENRHFQPNEDEMEAARNPEYWHSKVAADNVAPPCPSCGSHTTALLSDDGTCKCHNCNNKWTPDGAAKSGDAPVTSKTADTEHGPFEGVPAADQIAPDDPSQDVNPGQWKTTDGQPLKVGRQYEMYSQRYDVPDVVRVTSIKPDGIEYVLTGEYGLEHRTSVTKQEADMDGLTFVALDGADPTSDQQPDEPSAIGPDTSNKPTFAHVEAAVINTQCPSCGQPAQGSTAANVIMCNGCGSRNPLTNVIPAAHLQRDYPDFQGKPPMFPAQQYRSNVHEAGKKYTPMEQREFIDEPGKARNADKLDLAGTHYEDRLGLSDDYFLW